LAVRGGLRRGEQRRASFAQRDRASVVIQERNELPIAPDAALIERRVRRAPLKPQLLQLIRSLRRPAVHRFQQAAASGAIVEDLGDGKPRAALLLKTSKLRRHEASIIRSCSRFTWKTAVSPYAMCLRPRAPKASRCCGCSPAASAIPTS